MTISDATVNKILETLQQQMQEIQYLRAENEAIKNEQRNKDNASGVKSRRGNATEKPKRPNIEVGIDDIDWAVFEDSWKRYKKMTAIEGDEQICLELRAACSIEVNKLLFEFVGADILNDPSLTEEQLLKHIQAVAVRSIHKEVHRMNFGSLQQNDGESIMDFVARLKSQASLCDIMVTCACAKKISFANEMISQKLTAGISNPNHQSRILSEADTLTTLDSKISRLMGLETTDDATHQMKPIITASVGQNAAIRSNYKREQRNERQHAPKINNRNHDTGETRPHERDHQPYQPTGYRRYPIRAEG